MRIQNLYLFVFSLFLVSYVNSQEPVAPAEKLRLPEGFEAKLLYTVPKGQGSWVSITHDPKGRLICSDQYGSLYRIDVSGDELNVEKIELKIGHAQGLLCAFDALYVVAHGNNKKPAGLYRLKDTNDDDSYDKVELLREFRGGGEHGPHAVILSPDGKSLYICAGNHTKIPKPETSRVPRVWQEDQVTKRLPDAGGHAVGIKAPGGWVCKTDPDGKSFELISVGFRNQYDIAFDKNGELFTYDADMEWDVGLPWYRPTRVCHVTSGSEFGWRHGSGKWPDFYPDSVPAVLDIGPGSPTGIAFGTGAKFPAKYQDALFIADWSYGIIYAISMKANGASFSATKEPFCTAAALPVTDLVINKDGSMYFLTGGRRFNSALYRISYVGDGDTTPTSPTSLSDLGKWRRQLESMHQPTEENVDSNIEKSWKALSSNDRAIRFAGRTALEHLPTSSWAERAAKESDPWAIIETSLALVRSPNASQFEKQVNAKLSELKWDTLDDMQKLAVLRIYGLLTVRTKEIDVETRRQIASMASRLPTDSTPINRELARLLAGIDDDSIAKKGVELLEGSSTQEDQIHYAIVLHAVTKGWDVGLRARYFNWFLKAAQLHGGNSFGGYLKNIRKAAQEKLTESEQVALKDLLEQKPTTTDPYAELKARPVIKKWTVDDLMPITETELVSRDLDNGKKMFALTQCYKCHRVGRQGGIVGPDLTNAGRRLSTRDLLETIVDPDKEISDQYRATIFQLNDGSLVTGRVANLTSNRYMVQEDMLKPGKLTNVLLDQIEATKPARVSTMPSGLLDTLTREEILDLLAYMKSTAGEREAPSSR